MIPVLALVGRPNVGKSSLFNRLTRTRDAIVADYPGLTRDRQYGDAMLGDRRFIVIDTGGITGEEAGIDSAMASQSLQAIEEADAVLFMVDAREGLTGVDGDIARHLRSNHKQVFLVVNKIDQQDPDLATADFHALGFANLFPVSVTHGRGLRTLSEAVVSSFPAEPVDEHVGRDPRDGVRIAVVGRPNVGKSTLVNRMLGEERVVVYDQPGTTRDSISIDFEHDGKPYTLIDTAGIRRRRSVSETIEKFSIVKTLQAIEDANVVVLLLDAHEGVVEQDLHLLGNVIEKGRALVVAINKWDGLSQDARDRIKSELDRRLSFIDYAEIHYISALHGTGVGHLYKSIDAAYHSATRKLSTPFLTRILEDAVAEHAPPLVNGRRIKLRYAHAGGSNPPIIVIHGNQVNAVPAHYSRYLEKTFRRVLKLSGTPVRIEFRGGENPYEGRRNALTARQVKKRKRLIKHLKKKR